jgi:hypothetical protein
MSLISVYKVFSTSRISSSVNPVNSIISSIGLSFNSIFFAISIACASLPFLPSAKTTAAAKDVVVKWFARSFVRFADYPEEYIAPNDFEVEVVEFRICLYDVYLVRVVMFL